MATRKKFEPKIIKRITLPILRLVADTPVYVKIINAIVHPKKTAPDKDGRGKAGFFKVVNLETDDEMHFVPGAKVQADILENYPGSAYVDKCFAITKVKTAGQDGGRGYSSYDISEIAAASQ